MIATRCCQPLYVQPRGSYNEDQLWPELSEQYSIRCYLLETVPHILKTVSIFGCSALSANLDWYISVPRCVRRQLCPTGPFSSCQLSPTRPQGQPHRMRLILGLNLENRVTTVPSLLYLSSCPNGSQMGNPDNVENFKHHLTPSPHQKKKERRKRP